MTIREVTVDEFAEHLAGGGRVVDVREPREYAEAHIPGAVLVPLGEVPMRLDEFRGEGATHVICRSGGRSLHACEYAGARGADVVNVSGGMVAWITSGRAVETGAS